MARDQSGTPGHPVEALSRPQVTLWGAVDDRMLSIFRDQAEAAAQGEGPLAIELMTLGGDAEIGRRLALEVRLLRERTGRRILFVGKTCVYSAGVTMMAGFPPEDRYLTEDTLLLVHCRRLEETVDLKGPLPACHQRIREKLSQIEVGLRLEEDGFRQLIDGSDISLEEVREKAACNWYIRADEALARRLVAGVL